MSYSHHVDAMNGDVPIKEHWYRCDITGELIYEGWPRIHIDGTDVDISFDAVQQVIMPWYVKAAPVPFEMLVGDMKMRCGIRRDRRWPISASIRASVIIESGGKCVKCGSTERLQIDHIVPVKNGGPDDRENLQVLCQPCNLKKGTMSNQQFMSTHG